jgi:hypothetical protein
LIKDGVAPEKVNQGLISQKVHGMSGIFSRLQALPGVLRHDMRG